MKTRTKMMLMQQGKDYSQKGKVYPEEFRYFPQNNYPRMNYMDDENLEEEMAYRRSRDSRGRYTRRRGGNMNYGDGFRPDSEGGYDKPSSTYRDMDYAEPSQIGFTVPYQDSVSYGPESSSGNHIYMGHAKSLESPKSLNREKAQDWVKHMENADGSQGAHWTMEQAKATQDRLGLKVNSLEFYVALNMMYSDYGKVAKKFNVDNPDFYAHLACAFLEDEDSQEEKLSKYYHYIVEH